MQTRYWNLQNDTDGVMLREAAALIKQGEAVAFPTETVYGLGADGLNGEAVRKIFEPYIVVLNALPKIALGPLIIIWMGTGYTAIIFMTVLVSIIVCIMNMLAGFVAVDKTKLLLMRSMGANKLTMLIKLVIPASLPLSLIHI